MEFLRCMIILVTMSCILSACDSDRRQAINIQSDASTALTTPSITPAKQATSTEIVQQAVPLAVYYWPTSLPSALKIDSEASYVDEKGYFLKTTSTQGQTIFVVAGTSIEDENVLVPADVESKDIQVRGFQGWILNNGNGYSIFWEESDVLYGVLGTGMASREILTVAEELERVDFELVRQRLDGLR